MSAKQSKRHVEAARLALNDAAWETILADAEPGPRSGYEARVEFLAALLSAAENAAIERCAREAMRAGTPGPPLEPIFMARQIAAAIRALKEDK